MAGRYCGRERALCDCSAPLKSSLPMTVATLPQLDGIKTVLSFASNSANNPGRFVQMCAHRQWVNPMPRLKTAEQCFRLAADCRRAAAAAGVEHRFRWLQLAT